MDRKFNDEYQKFLEGIHNNGEQGMSYIDWLEYKMGEHFELRKEIIHIRNMINLLCPEIIPPEGGSLGEVIGILISKASRNRSEHAEQ